MLSIFYRKPLARPREDRALRRTNGEDAEGVIYASKNEQKGISFSFSGPAGSRHANEALAIAGHVYSNEKDTKKKVNLAKCISSGNDVEDKDKDEDVEEVVAAIVPQKKSIERKQRPVEATGNGNRDTRTTDDVRSVLSTAPSDYSRTNTASRHSTGPSELSEVASMASTQVSINRHGVPIAGKAFKHESGTQLTYGVRDDGRQLFVSAPKNSSEAGLLRQVAEKATGSDVSSPSSLCSGGARQADKRAAECYK